MGPVAMGVNRTSATHAGLTSPYEYRVETWAREVRRLNPLLSDLLMDLNKVLHACDYVMAGDSSKDFLDKEWELFRTKWMSEDGYRERVLNCIWSEIRLIDEKLVPEDVLKELGDNSWRW